MSSGVAIPATQVLSAASSLAGPLGSQRSSTVDLGHQQPAEGNLLLMGRESTEAGGYHAPSQILPAMRRSLGVSAVRHSQNKGSGWIKLIASPDSWRKVADQVRACQSQSQYVIATQNACKITVSQCP